MKKCSCGRIFGDEHFFCGFCGRELQFIVEDGGVRHTAVQAFPRRNPFGTVVIIISAIGFFLSALSLIQAILGYFTVGGMLSLLGMRNIFVYSVLGSAVFLGMSLLGMAFGSRLRKRERHGVY